MDAILSWVRRASFHTNIYLWTPVLNLAPHYRHFCLANLPVNLISSSKHLLQHLILWKCFTQTSDPMMLNWWTERILIVRWKQSRIIFAAKGPFSSVACFKHHESCSCNPDFRLTAQNSTENQQRVNECTTVCFEGGKNTHCRTSASCSATLAILEISCSYRVPNDRRNEFLGGYTSLVNERVS